MQLLLPTIEIQSRHHAGEMFRRRERGPSCRRAFSLLEAMVSLTLLTMIAAVLIGAAQSAANSVSLSMDEFTAEGIAQLVMDEAMGYTYVDQSYTASDPNGVEITAMGNSVNSGSRYGGSWGDIDDFNGASPTTTYVNQPPTDCWGATFGLGAGTNTAGNPDLRNPSFQLSSNYFSNWQLQTNCYYVSPTDFSQRLTTGTSWFRALEVRVYRVLPDGSLLLLRQLRRVHCHVPKPTT